jgi:tetratricopeptide (TPR) repeat protein
MINIGLCHAYQGNFSKAIGFINQAFEVCKEQCLSVKTNGEFAYGVVDFMQSDLSRARNRFLVSYELAIERKDLRFQAENLIFLGKIETKEGNFTEANRYFLNAEKAALPSKYNLLLMDAYFELSKLHKETNHIAASTFYQNKYVELRSQMFSEDITNNLMAIQSEFEGRESERIISDSGRIIESQKALAILLIIVVIVFIVLAAFLWVKISATRLINSKLDLKIKERTKDLEQNKAKLQGAHLERIKILQSNRDVLIASIATMKGIYNLATLDVSDEKAQDYLRKNLHVAQDLSSLVDKISPVDRDYVSNIEEERAGVKILPIDLPEGKKDGSD